MSRFFFESRSRCAVEEQNIKLVNVCVSVFVRWRTERGGAAGQRPALLRSLTYNMQRNLDSIHGGVRTAFLEANAHVFPFREFNIFW